MIFQSCNLVKQVNEDVNSFRVFKLPPNALWYPPGSKCHGSNVYFSISYCPLESEIIDEAFEDYCSEDSTNDKEIAELENTNSNQIFERNLEFLPSLECYSLQRHNKIYDIAPFLQNNEFSRNIMKFHTSSNDYSNKNSNKIPGRPTEQQLREIQKILSDTVRNLINVIDLNYQRNL